MNIFSSFMASFQDIKKGLNKPKPKPSEGTTPIQNVPTPPKKPASLGESTIFEYEECRLLLNMIASSDFKGKDVQMVYNIALKLQTLIQDNYIEDTDE